MAYAHGTATDITDLWNKFVTFITANATLVAASQNWSIVWTAPGGQKDGIVLKGPGAAGADNILVGLRRFDAAATDGSYIDIRGMTGVLTNALDINGHINSGPIARSFFDQNSMEYWFVANGRRFVILAKMSTVYSMIYGGFILPYANPLAYPYPLFVGGCAPDYLTGNTSSNIVDNWRSQSESHRNFMFSEFNNVSTNTTNAQRTSGYLLGSDGGWLNVGDDDADAACAMSPWRYNPNNAQGVNDWNITKSLDISYNNFGYDEMRSRIEENVGGGYSLGPMTVIKSMPSTQTIGVLDGLFWVPGQNNAVENTISLDSKDHLVIQNVFRTAVNQYSALRLD